MEISLNSAGKKYYKEWIFRNASTTFSTGNHTVILGPNGSGKSTLLQVISGAILPTEGSLSYLENKNAIADEHMFRSISIAAPYLELIEEFTLREILNFHFKFKGVYNKLEVKDVLIASGLSEHSEKIFRYFSSGMKQRVKLVLALMSDTPVVLLDEPCSNLDNSGVAWYKGMIAEFATGRLIIVASNQTKEEYFFCERILNMADLKI